MNMELDSFHTTFDKFAEGLDDNSFLSIKVLIAEATPRVHLHEQFLNGHSGHAGLQDAAQLQSRMGLLQGRMLAEVSSAHLSA